MLLGFNLNDDAVTVAIYFITLAFVVGSFFGLRWLLALRFGKLLRASRDGSNRMRFLGYDPAPYKVVAFTIAAVMTGVSGAMFTLPADRQRVVEGKRVSVRGELGGV